MAKKPDFVGVVKGVDYYLLKRLDLTEKELKVSGSIYLLALTTTTLYLLGKIKKLNAELEEFKTAKGD